MPGTAPGQTYDINSAAAKEKHKSVLWPIIMDGQPYAWVDRPGTTVGNPTLE